MISICIPVYNLDVRDLVRSLLDQAEGIPAEIILIDDGSDEEFRKLNRSLADRGVQYHELTENIGRARIRNLFTQHATFSQLLFLDCDSEIISDDFLPHYAQEMQRPGIICGGRIYPDREPEKNRRLHWKYGTRRESQPAEIRRRDPNRSFMTNNFMIPLEILRRNPFNEQLLGYGHEDSLFGYMLSKKQLEIRHIDNPVLHGDLETNREFIAKTAEAVRNLVYIAGMLKEDPGFRESITLLRTVARLEQNDVYGILRMLLRISTPLSRTLLGMGATSLKLLDLYKLGLCLELRKA